MPTIYLHIGRGKTGTTTIQQYLAAHHETLLAQNLHYIRADGGMNGAGHQNFAKSFISRLPHYMVPPNKPDAVRKAVADEIVQTTSNSIIISSENLEMADIGQVRLFFRELPVSCEVKIIFFVRSQDELAESEYNQMVKLKRETRPVRKFVDCDFTGCDFMAAAARWERHFGRENMICRIFDGRQHDVVSQFAACFPNLDVKLICPENTQRPADHSNTSIGIKALVVARLLNTIELDSRFQQYTKLFAELRDHDFPALLFDSVEAGEFRRRFADSNRAFTSRYLGYECEDLGGRRYTDQERDEIRSRIKSMGLISF